MYIAFFREDEAPAEPRCFDNWRGGNLAFPGMKPM
jgi:hypothetical protein